MCFMIDKLSEKSIGGFVLSRVIGHYDDKHRDAIMVDADATALALTKESTPQGTCFEEYHVVDWRD
eukprot:scaffold1709_cov74-Skeletonema_dohrnii-CCMP3373.AAC.5